MAHLLGLSSFCLLLFDLFLVSSKLQHAKYGAFKIPLSARSFQ